MDDKELEGKIVYLTIHYERWLREINSEFNIPMVNRIAKVIKVFDWDTHEGRILLSARKKTNKWGKLNPEDFKFVLQVFCPELISKGKKGLKAEEVLPHFYPGTELLMFDILPDWILSEINSKKYDNFKLSLKQSSSSDPKKCIAKKVVKKKDVSRQPDKSC